MTEAPDLWRPGEPSDADEQAFLDLHGPQPDEPREITDVPTGDLL